MENRTEFSPQTRYAPIDMTYYEQRAKQLKLQNQALRQQTSRSPYIQRVINQPQYIPTRISPPSRYVEYRQPFPTNLPISYYSDNSYFYDNSAQNSIIELQSRNQRLQREASQLQRSIKTDLVHFVRDSNVHRQCSYKQKYIKSLNYRPQYSRIHFR